AALPKPEERTRPRRSPDGNDRQVEGGEPTLALLGILVEDAERDLGKLVGRIVDRHAGESPLSQSRVGGQGDEMRRETEAGDPVTIPDVASAHLENSSAMAVSDSPVPASCRSTSARLRRVGDGHSDRDIDPTRSYGCPRA